MQLKLKNFFTIFLALPASAWAASDHSGRGPGATDSPCSQSLKESFRPDAQTTVVLVRPFRKGEPLVLSGELDERTPRAVNDLCLVKLNVGPGNPGPAGAPSTSSGIGIEVWLPSPENWNERLHVFGGGGWVGGWAGSADAIAEPRAAAVAGGEGAVSSSTDAGHSGTIAGSPSSGGDFAMNPDGTVNRVLWQDFATRAIHEQAVKTKALAAVYYGRPAKFSYWDGASTGGRQALKLAQEHPEDFDGIIAAMPAIYWTNFAVAGVYAQVVIQRDLGGIAPTEAQQDLVSNAAIRACDRVGGRRLGYIMDQAACRYDPTQDAEVLCVADGGRVPAPACVTRLQARAINKIWYGPTRDGTAPAPSVDNGWDRPLGGNRLWYGLPRGTSLYNAHYSRLFKVNAGFANPGGPWTLASDMVALALQDPAIAAPNFQNARANGADGWKALSYAKLAEAFDRGLAQQEDFARINTDNPDLTAFKARGGKLIGWQGINDEVIPVQGMIHYYDSVLARMGGLSAVRDFYRLYLLPGNGHGPYNGTSNPVANPPTWSGNQVYAALVDWVERGKAPDRLELSSPAGSPDPIAQPACPYPQRAVFSGGNPAVSASYVCREALSRRSSAKL